MTPEIRYARAADGTHVAYQVHGEGPIDILVLRAWHSNLEHDWEEPILTGVHRRLGSIGRVVRLDRRGTGLSDRLGPDELPTLEHRVDDMRAVLDAIRSERVVLIGLAQGAALCTVFAATYPERTAGLVIWAPPWTLVGRGDKQAADTWAAAVSEQWGTEELAQDIVNGAAPSRAHDPAFVEWIRRDQLASGTAQDAATQWRLVQETNVDDILLGHPCSDGRHVAFRDLHSRGPYVAGRIPNARAIELPGEDHILISTRVAAGAGRGRAVHRGPGGHRAGARSRPGRGDVHRHRGVNASGRRPSATRNGEPWSISITQRSVASSPATVDARSTPPAMGSSPRSTHRRGPFAARWPCARPCGATGSSCGSASTSASASASDRACADSPYTPGRASAGTAAARGDPRLEHREGPRRRLGHHVRRRRHSCAEGHPRAAAAVPRGIGLRRVRVAEGQGIPDQFVGDSV